MPYNEKLVLELVANNEMSDKITDATNTVKKLNKEIKELSDSTKGVDESSQSIWQKMSSVIDKVQDKVEGVNRTVRHYNTMMEGFNRGVIDLFQEAGEVVYDFTSDSIDNFTQLSEQHAKTLGAMANNYDKTSASQARFLSDSKRLKEQALELGTYGVNGNGALTDATGVSEAQTELIKAGLTADDILNGGATKSVLTFAQANGLDTESAVEFAVSLGNQFGVPVDQWDSMLDKVSHTADLSIIGVSDIVQSMKYASGISSGVGIPLEETLGMVGVLGDFGLRGSQAGSSIQALITRMLTGDTTVITDAQAKIAPPKALDAFNQFEKEAKPNGELLPMTEVIDQLDEIMGTLNDSEQAWFAKKLFGLYQMKGAYALISGDSDGLAETIEQITNDSDNTNLNKLDQILESQYGQLTSLNNMWESVKTDMGDRVSPLVNAIRDELFNFLSSTGNYDINFDNLRSALDESADLIAEKYGTALGDAVRGVGNLTIDFAEVVEGVAPEFASGLLEMLGKAVKFDIPGTVGEWNDMIGDMKDAVEDLPADLRNMGDAVVNVIDMFGKLAAFNIAMQGLEGATNLVLLVTNISSAMTTLVGLLGGVPGIALAVAGIAAIIGVQTAAGVASANMDRESVARNVYQFDDYDATIAGSKTTTGMRAKMSSFLKENGITEDSDTASLLTDEMDKYVYEQSLQGKTVTTDEYIKMLGGLYGKYTELVSGGSGLLDGLGNPLNANPIDNTSFSGSLYKFDQYGNADYGSKTTLYSELYDYLVNNVPGMENKSGAVRVEPVMDTYPVDIYSKANIQRPTATQDNTNRVLIDGNKDVLYDDPNISMWDRLGAAFSKDAYKYGLPYSDGSIFGGLSNWDFMAGNAMYDETGIRGWWYNGEDREGAGNGKYKEYNDQIIDAMNQNMVNQAMAGIDWGKVFTGIDFSGANGNTERGHDIPGWAALSDKGMEEALSDQEIINTNMQFSPSIILQPPSVTVDVKVDKDGNATKSYSILDPALLFGNNANIWYNKNLSQYGQNSK
jgi:TP901 family phage tail tape measure protein